VAAPDRNQHQPFECFFDLLDLHFLDFDALDLLPFEPQLLGGV
jgi:hypothetical protein